jgi:hypothetical protein
MNREQDFDQTLKAWLDDGADVAPERFVWAALDDVERTAQRGTWKAPLEGLLMKLKPAAPIFGVAAVILLAIAAYSIVGGNIGGPGSTPEPTPSARAYTIADLDSIVITTSNAPEGVSVDRRTSGREALVYGIKPGGPTIDQTGYVAALMTEITHPDGGYASWAAIYETAADAERAYDSLVDAHVSTDGWGMSAGSDAGLGDESITLTGPAYDFENVTTVIWRRGNLLLVVVAVFDADPEPITTLMDARTR